MYDDGLSDDSTTKSTIASFFHVGVVLKNNELVPLS